MEKHAGAIKPPNPFNSGSPVDPNDFVGRVQEIDNFKQKLRQTASGSLASMSVAGSYGVGKTSFLHKCKSIAENEGALTIYFSLNELSSIDKETLARILIMRVKETVREQVILQRLSGAVLTILQTIKLKFDSGVELGISPIDEATYPNLQSALSAAWNALKPSKTAIVFLIDEAGILERNKGELLLYLRAVLEQLQISRVPVMIVPAGKISIIGPSGTGFSPIVRTFPPAFMYNFAEDESNQFITKKLSQVNKRISTPALKKAYEVSEGHPYVLTAYLAAAYSKLEPNENEITTQHFEATDVEFVPRILGPFFSRFYDQAGKFSKEILRIMAKNPSCSASLSELTKSLHKSNNHLSPFLAKLVQDGSIIRIDRGQYRLFHHLLANYIELKSKNAEVPKGQNEHHLAGSEATQPISTIHISEGTLPPLGERNAPVKIVVFGDFQAPFCNRLYVDTEPILKRKYIDSGLAKLYHRDFPLPFHPHSVLSALVARSANEQGKFWEMRNKLLETQATWSGLSVPITLLRSYALEIGLDEKKFLISLENKSLTEAISNDKKEAESYGVGGTPTIFLIFPNSRANLDRIKRTVSEINSKFGQGITIHENANEYIIIVPGAYPPQVFEMLMENVH